MAKRGNGEGTIYFDAGRNRWLGQLSLPNGKRKQVSGKTRREAQQKLAQVRREIEAGMHGTTLGEKTLREFAEQVVIQRSATRRSKTVINYHWLLNHHLDGIGDIPLTKLTPVIFHDYFTRKLADYESGTVNNMRMFLHMVLAEAVELEILPRNPINRKTTFIVTNEEQHPLTLEQVRSLVRALRGDRFEAFHLVGLCTGMRHAEILGLRWQDIDFNARRLYVRNTLHKLPDIGFVLEGMKSRSSRRTLPLPDPAVEALLRWRELQNEERYLCGSAWNEVIPDLVFTKQDGSPWYPSSGGLKSPWQRALRRAGITFPHDFHDQRHTFATLLIEDGVPIKTVSEWLGHASIAITLQIYGHVTPKMRDQALDRINFLIAPAEDELHAKLHAASSVIGTEEGK